MPDRRTFLASAAAAAGFGSLFGAADQAPGKKKTLLVVGAHMDDCEGAGGLMLKAVKAGHRVVAVETVGDWSNWPPAQGIEDKVKAGVLRINKEVGIEKIIFDYKYHQVPVDIQIKTRIAKIVDDIQPDIACIIHESDYWTDHANTSRSAKDGIMFPHGYLAKKVKTPSVILTYHAGTNQTFDFQPDTYLDCTGVIDRLAWMINELDGLLSNGPKYTTSMTLLSSQKKMDLTGHADQALAARRYWGARVGVQFAEAFHSIRTVARELW
jgi:LmbE family N-acetylglucosaminyl deacetylase